MEAEMLLFLINIFNVCARPHDTGRRIAMGHAKGMAQFMDNHFFETIQLYLIIPGHSISFIAESVKRCNSSPPAQQSLAENEGKNRNEQVNVE